MRHCVSKLLFVFAMTNCPLIASADVVKIAAVGPLTGPITQYGDMMREGIMTAVEKYNAEGGVDGHTFEIVKVDDACEPKQGPISANTVVNQGIHFVVGPVCSGATLGSAPIFDEQGIVMITPNATSPAVTEGKGYRYIFRTIGRDDQQGEVAAQYIAQKKFKKIAILHDKQSYGQGIAAATRESLQKLGVKTVVFEGINAGESDYSSLLTKLKSDGIDLVYYGGYHPELGLLLRQSRELGFKAQFMGAEGAGNPEINAIAGKAVEGMLLTLPRDFSLLPENKEIVKLFRDKGRDPSGAFQLSAYAATQAIAEAIRATKGTDTEKIADWLHSHQVKTVIGDLTWQMSGDLTSFPFDVFVWHADGGKTLAK